METGNRRRQTGIMEDGKEKYEQTSKVHTVCKGNTCLLQYIQSIIRVYSEYIQKLSNISGCLILDARRKGSGGWSLGVVE